MIVETQKDFLEWFGKFPDHEPNVTDQEFYFHSDEAQSFRVSLPAKPGQLVFLASLIVTCQLDEHLWDGGYIWFTEWGIWGQQEIGYRMVERLRNGYGDANSFETATVQNYRVDERLDIAGSLLLSILFGWDTWYGPKYKAESPDFVVFISHDEFVEVTCRTREAYSSAFAAFEQVGFNPSQTRLQA
jgi:hypothetical protein